MFGLLLFSSCNENESESFITKEMKNYISNNVDGSYGFFERNMVKEHIDSFSWKSDIYRIQRQLYMYASQRRTILANNYVPLTKTTGWLFPNIFESNGDRIYYACGYRTASGAIVDRQFVLYTNGEKNFIEIFELKYNYEMLRDFVQHNLNVDLEESYIQTLLAKYKAIESEDKESQNSFLTIPTSTISNKYSAIFRRLEKY